MKKFKKLALAIGGLFLSTMLLSGCTANFCEPVDQAHIMFALDYGVTSYYDKTGENVPENAVDVTWNSNVKVVYEISEKFTPQIYSANSTADNNGLKKPSLNYWAAYDYVFLSYIAEQADKPLNTWTANDFMLLIDNKANTEGTYYKYGYLKYFGTGENQNLWYNYNVFKNRIFDETKTSGSFNYGGITVYHSDCPTTDYYNLYNSVMTTSINSCRSCLATQTGQYGAYGPLKLSVEIKGKAWTDWKGLLEFILIWPIGALIDVLTKGFLGGGIANGWAQILSIFIVTIIVRSIVFALTFKSTQGNAKMTALQPEIQKIQNKYPNSKTNKYEQQRMSQEMSVLYKKNKINPLSTLIVLIVQFPVFICVWGAMQGSAYLSTGTFLGLNLSESISSVLFNASAWQTGSAWTALVLFLLMAASQVFSMLIPQWMQKKRAKQAAKLGVNPSANQQNKTMKIFTIVMLVMVIFMGFSLASGLGVYWFVGALFSIAQTFITQAITDRAQKKHKNAKVVN